MCAWSLLFQAQIFYIFLFNFYFLYFKNRKIHTTFFLFLFFCNFVNFLFWFSFGWNFVGLTIKLKLNLNNTHTKFYCFNVLSSWTCWTTDKLILFNIYFLDFILFLDGEQNKNFYNVHKATIQEILLSFWNGKVVESAERIGTHNCTSAHGMIADFYSRSCIQNVQSLWMISMIYI